MIVLVIAVLIGHRGKGCAQLLLDLAAMQQEGLVTVDDEWVAVNTIIDERTGAPIDPARLEAMPAARTDVEQSPPR